MRLARRGPGLLVPALVVAAMAACTSEPPPAAPPAGAAKPAPTGALRPVALPPLVPIEPQLRQRLEAQQTALDALRRVAVTQPADLAQAFGDVGRLCLAAEFPTAALPYLQNARQLAPAEFRWAYYLGHAFRQANDAPAARDAWAAAVALRPGDVPARVWLGRSLVDDGHAAEALPHLEAAAAADPRSAAARFQLGRAALAQQRFRDAAAHLEAALSLDPSATAAHFPLAAAYRGLGDQGRAAEHARLWREGEVVLADPLMDEVGRLLQTSLDFAVRGTRALDSRDWTRAIALFRQGLEQSPGDAVLHLNLGTALYLSGSPAAALTEFEIATRLTPGNARAHFNTGVLLEEAGRDGEAVARFSRAVELDPTLVDARFSLADAQRRTGQLEPALAQYQIILDADPNASQARLGLGMGLVRLGRYGDARRTFEEAAAAHPDQLGFAHALARVLAAAPDPAVRDGQRAQDIVTALQRSLPPGTQNPALLETAAMAAAAVGAFERATALQRAVVADARRTGPPARLPFIEGNLARYARRETGRQPWADDDPVHQPRRAAGLASR